MQPMQQSGQMQPMQSMQAAAPQPPSTSAQRMGYSGSIFVPGQSNSMGGGGGAPASSDSLAAGLASGAEALGISGDAAAKMQQMAAGVALDYMAGRTPLDGSLASGAVSSLNQAAASFTGSRLDTLRYYFDVNNAYVLQKLQILLLPYRHADWERKGDAGQAAPPSQDANAPDLYLPLMGLVTYILVAGFVSGADGRFTPEVLASTASTGMAIVLLEVVLIKLTLYLLQAEGSVAPALELASCSGYKFMAAVLVLLTNTVAGSVAGYVAIAVASANIGTFMVNTIRQCLAQGSGFTPGFMTDGMGSPGSEKRKKQLYSLLGVAALQPFFFWYLSSV